MSVKCTSTFDEFTIDFTNIGNSKTLDGAAGSDRVNLTSSTSTITTDTQLAASSDFNDIETLDLTNLTMNVGADASDGGTNAEWTLDGALLESWTDTGNSLTLNLDTDAASKLEFTDKNGIKYGGDDSGTVAITNTTYTLDSGGTDIDLIVTGL